MHATHASNTSKAPASVTSKRESLAGRQTKTVQETKSIPKVQIYTSNCQPLCGGRPIGPATNGHVHKPRGRQRRHNHRTKTSISSIYKAISKDCRQTRAHAMDFSVTPARPVLLTEVHNQKYTIKSTQSKVHAGLRLVTKARIDVMSSLTGKDLNTVILNEASSLNFSPIRPPKLTPNDG